MVAVLRLVAQGMQVEEVLAARTHSWVVDTVVGACFADTNYRQQENFAVLGLTMDP